MGRDATDLLNGADVLFVNAGDDRMHFLALRGEANANRTAIHTAALMAEVAKLNELLDVVGNVRAEIIAAGAQLTRRHIVVADVIQQQCLNRIDIGATATIELVLDHVKEAAVKTLNQGERFKIK